MSDWEGLKRKSTRKAALEAARRIKKNATAKKPLSRVEEGGHRIYETKIAAQINSNATSLSPVIAAMDGHGDDGRWRSRGRKRKRKDQVVDPALSPSKARLTDNKIRGFTKGNPPTSEGMPKKRRGRPPKPRLATCMARCNGRMKFKRSSLKQKQKKEAGHDLYLRRESYNSCHGKNELVVPTIFNGPKQLLPGTGGISYKESLMRFCKDLGPTAQRVTCRMLSRRALIDLAPPQPEPLLPLSQPPPPHLCLLDADSTNGLVKNIKTNLFSPPLIGFGNGTTNASAYHKGKTIVGDEVENNGKKREVGNRDIINRIGSFLSNHHGNVKRNEVDLWNVHQATPRNGKPNSCVYPSTYLQPAMKVSSSVLALGGGESSVPWVPQPSEYRRPPAQPPQKWSPPPPETTNPLVMQEEELQLALASYMQMTDRDWFQNPWAPSEPSPFSWLDRWGMDQQLPDNVNHGQAHPNMFDNVASQPQYELFMATQPPLSSPTAMVGVIPRQDSLPFGLIPDFGL